MLEPTRRFRIAPCPPEQVQALRQALSVSGPLAEVLVRRGLADPGRAQAFLAADAEHPPQAFAGIERALVAIERHVAAGTRITVHGDYDVDGICSTAVLVRALRALGANVDWYLPDRATDGYGLNPLTVRRLAERGTRLLVTVDCAITAVAEVQLALDLGMEVVVTDHHAPRADGQLPAAPIVHPAVCDYPCPDLCATAVAYKLAQALWCAAGERSSAAGVAEPERYDPRLDLDLVALATIADVVALRGENRTLVRRGLRALAGTAKPGLRALMTVARVAQPGPVSERAVGFALAPRLNAAGRLYRADAGLELILTEDTARAEQIAAELDRANYERRRTELRILSEAERHVAALGERAGYVLAGEDWHAGVIGIVASRLAERHHRPFVLVALDGQAGRGSGRGIERFDLLGALHACGGHLLRYGGHRAAAGLEVSRERLVDFGEAFAAHAEQVLGSERAEREERVDAVVQVDELGMELAEELAQLAPFGAGNPTVSLLVRGAVFADRRPMGEGRHVRFTLRHGPHSARAVAFGGGATLPVRDGTPADATFTLEVNEWRGVSEPRLVLRHAQPAAVEPARVAESQEGELVLF
ncbi:MAG TPA: single-stranded-DNA-specific exonuclease RecJ [Solirubrobacteraceae bacterium]|nr:single-stranded-DNA-specific exonuclease RecJ [Solirubrobacteraceae bacterium]